MFFCLLLLESSILPKTYNSMCKTYCAVWGFLEKVLLCNSMPFFGLKITFFYQKQWQNVKNKHKNTSQLFLSHSEAVSKIKLLSCRKDRTMIST